jgi:multidrug efflux system outer membrane protein
MRKSQSLFQVLTIATAAVILGACALDHPTDRLADTDVPQEFSGPIPSDADTWPKAEWWTGFNSQELNTLIASAQSQNLDLAAAAARIMQAEGQARVAGSALLPTVNLSANAQQSGPIGNGRSSTSRSYSVQLGASYELDFWGKNRATLTAAEEALASSRYDRETVALTVTATVAQTYFQVLSLRDRRTTAQQNLANANDVLRIIQARVKAGVASPLDLAQQQAAVANQAATIPDLDQSERQARATLALLLGLPPQNFDITGKNLEGLGAPLVKPGMPSGLLARRPDIRKSEADLASADANIDAARAAFFPTISLTGSAGFASTALSSLFNPANAAYTIGASLLQTIFDGGRLQGEYDTTVGRRQELVATYRNVVITAFSDVHVALGGVANLTEEEKQRRIAVEQSAEAYRIAQLQYKAGIVDFTSVLSAQSTLFAAQDQLSQTRLARLNAIVTLFRALGGGWNDEPQVSSVN